MFSNPLIKRYSYSAFRMGNLAVVLPIYFAFMILLVVANYSMTGSGEGFENFFSTLYYQVLGIQIFMLCIVSPFLTGNAIHNDIVNKSYEFFKLLPLTALQKAVGVLVGKNIMIIIVALMNFMLLAFYGFMGNISWTLNLHVILALASVSIFMSSLSLLLSIKDTKSKRNYSNGLLVLFVLFSITPIINLVDLFVRGKEEGMPKINFWGLEVPVLILVSSLAIYFSIWAIKGIVRKFTYEKSCLFTPFGALLFTALAEVIILGLSYEEMGKAYDDAYLFWGMCLIPIVYVMITSLKSYEQYYEYTFNIKSDSLGMNLLNLVCRSNLAHHFGLFMIWLCCGIFIGWKMDTSLIKIMLCALVVCSFYVIFSLGLELNILFRPLTPKIIYLIGFVYLLTLILPPIVGFSAYNIFGYFAHKIDGDSGIAAKEPFIILFNSVLIAVPVLILSLRYSAIVKDRLMLNSGEIES